MQSRIRVDVVAEAVCLLATGALLLLVVGWIAGCSGGEVAGSSWPPAVELVSGGGSGHVCVRLDGRLVCATVSEQSDAEAGQHCVRAELDVEVPPWGSARATGIVPGSSESCGGPGVTGVTLTPFRAGAAAAGVDCAGRPGDEPARAGGEDPPAPAGGVSP